MADLGDPAPLPTATLFWVKKGKITEERKAGRASKTKLPPLNKHKVWICHCPGHFHLKPQVSVAQNKNGGAFLSLNDLN